mmetsp:Transcript_21368/g.31780  ORF Transcript_21368/g.31780 Transcript_21368/m.31780 type:complete len:398 (-) Transcript_21368:4464-5657(-)
MADRDQNTRDTPEELCAKARKLWLNDPRQLDRVEEMYRTALLATKKVRQRSNKFRRIQALAKPDYRAAGEKMALILCQSGRSSRAKDGLAALGFNCRLADCALNYPMSEKEASQLAGTDTQHSPCLIYDNFLSPDELLKLRQIFQNPKASYWRDHNYRVEPPSPYFSYVYHLRKDSTKTFLGSLARRIQRHCRNAFPEIRRAKYVELWAHCRPHATGHQLHFDSDNEGRGGDVKNPICSTVLYLTDGCGGPSIITNQRLSDQHLATSGWLAHSAARRLVAFDGSVLHGVIPGKGAPSPSAGKQKNHRVTLMLAFWREIRIRDDESGRFGAARSLPAKANWSIPLLQPTTSNNDDFNSLGCSRQVDPIFLPHVYEDLDGQRLPKDQALPSYDTVFQGF